MKKNWNNKKWITLIGYPLLHFIQKNFITNLHSLSLSLSLSLSIYIYIYIHTHQKDYKLVKKLFSVIKFSIIKLFNFRIFIKLNFSLIDFFAISLVHCNLLVEYGKTVLVQRIIKWIPWRKNKKRPKAKAGPANGNTKY